MTHDTRRHTAPHGTAGSTPALGARPDTGTDTGTGASSRRPARGAVGAGRPAGTPAPGTRAPGTRGAGRELAGPAGELEVHGSPGTDYGTGTVGRVSEPGAVGSVSKPLVSGMSGSGMGMGDTAPSRPDTVSRTDDTPGDTVPTPPPTTDRPVPPGYFRLVHRAFRAEHGPWCDAMARAKNEGRDLAHVCRLLIRGYANGTIQV